MADNSPPIDPILSRVPSLSFYPSPHKSISPQKIIGIISIIALSVFFSIASFYNAQLSFAIINTCFFALLGGSIIYSLLIPSVDRIPASHSPAKPRRSRAYSCPHRRISLIKEDGEDGVCMERPSHHKVHFKSNLSEQQSTTEPLPHRVLSLLRRQTAPHPPSPSFFGEKVK